MTTETPRSIITPRATYRIQFRPEFTLDDAAAVAPYLHRLGISHLYASPYLQAASGSTHGYDVVDYSKVSRELGGKAAWERLAAALRQHQLGQILDMVPNHMAISPDNPWWWDVLENGPSSRYAAYFDVEWNPPETRHQDLVLLPVLGDQYGRELEAGKLQLFFENGAFTLRYYDSIFPIDPQTLGGLLTAAGERIHNSTLIFLGGAYGRLPVSTATDRSSAARRYRDADVLNQLLARLLREQPGVDGAIQEMVVQINSDPDALDVFLRRQNYRPANWQISARELGYRRFFDINSMIGLHMEDDQVFTDTHERVLGWLADGALQGLRIDHPDGLRDPEAYFSRLRLSAPQAYIVVEKILEPGESLPESWPVQGTTGYDFLNLVNGVLVDTSAEPALTDFYTTFSGRSADYTALVREKKLLAANEVLGSDLSRLTELFSQVCESRRNYRDYTRNILHDVLAETAACLPVYRTYICPSPEARANGTVFTPADEAYIDQAISAAKANRPDLDPRLFDFLCDLLLLRDTGAGIEELVMRFQQFTGPVMAKGVEDTVFYSFNRFISLNEVGGDPGRFGVPVADFHAACQSAQAHWPLTMLTTSTHDTKRSEDVRARLDVLSEMPEAWAETVTRWAGMNAHLRVESSGDWMGLSDPRRHGRPKGSGAISDENKGTDAAAMQGAVRPDTRWPDRNTEYLIYQTLVGAWPLEKERLLQYLEKAGRESKEFTSWTSPNTEFEESVAAFAGGILENPEFVRDLESFVMSIREPGWINSLSQTLIKLTAPGVPDIYQGCDLWSYALVDPDNRRPVDYHLRRELLNVLDASLPPEEIWARVSDGLPKLWLIRQALAVRTEHPDWFGAQSTYEPLRVAEDAALAYLRAYQLAVIVPRLVTRSRSRWDQLTLTLPAGTWRNVLTYETIQGGDISLGTLLKRFPAALLVK